MKLQVLVKKVNGLVLPVKANPDDAGYDIVAAFEPNIVGEKFERPLDGIKAWSRVDYVEYRTNLFIAPEGIKQFHNLIFPRSSISKKNLALANSVAVIDSSYRGEVSLRFKYVFQPNDFVILPESGRDRIYAIINPETIYQKGDKIAQIIPCQIADIEFITVESLNATKRGEGGFGSSS